MNLDSLSFSLSQISYLVANLTKKNFKQNTSELLSLVERHGTEAERHLFRCLFSWIDFGGDGKSTGKDHHQIQLLIQEFASVITRPSFITTICHSIENPFSHQKSLVLTNSLIPNISRVLHFTKVQEIAVAVSLQHSTYKELQKIATDFLNEKFPIFLQLCNSIVSEGKKSTENEVGLQDIPVEVLHLLLSYLIPNTSIEPGLKQSFINLLRKDYPSERCPLVLLPFLFDKEDDIQFEKLLAESSVASIMSSSNSAGQKLTSTAMSLPDIIRESGYNACSSVEDFRKLLQTYKIRSISASNVAKILTMMARTTSSSLDSVPLLSAISSGNVWGDKDKNDDQQSGWNVDNFIQVARETNSSLSTREVLMEFDFPGFTVEDAVGFKLLVRGLQLLLAQHESMPVDVVFRTWNNTKGQLSWLTLCVKNPSVFPIGELASRSVSLEILKQPVDDDVTTSIWKSLDLHDCLLRLAEFGLYSEVHALYEWPCTHCPDLLALALVQVGITSRSLQHDLIRLLIPIFLGSHPNSAIILNYMWNTQTQSTSVTGIRQVIIHSIAEWYTSYDQYDQQKLSRILDIAQDLKALSFLLNSKPFSFVIDLAVLASRREYLKLDKWLNDKIGEHREEFIQACVNFLKRRCPSIVVRSIVKEELSQSMNLPADTLTTLLLCLRSYMSNVSPELSDQIMLMYNNCNTVISKTRQPPPGVMNKPPAPPNVPATLQSVLPAAPTLPPAPSNMESVLNKPIDSVMGTSGFGTGKSMLPGQNPLSAFGQSSDFVGPAPSNNRMPSAIGSNTAGGSNISSPAGAGILPPHTGISDVVGMSSVLRSTGSGAVGPIGGSTNPGSQFLGDSSGFSSSIAQSLTSQLGTGTGNSNSFGLGGIQTSAAGRFGASQSGFSDSLSQGFSSNPLLSNIGNVSGLPSGSDAFSSNKLDLLSSQKPDTFRNKMQDIFSQNRTGGLGSTSGMGMGSGSSFGTSFGGGLNSTGLDIFGQKKPPTTGMLNQAAQQAFQQASVKTSKPPINDFSQVSPEMNQQFSKEIEDEANGYFQRIYNQPPHPTLTVDAILELLQNFKDSNNNKEKEVFNCMMRNLFEEYRFFPQYPDKELHITACLFGGIIEKNLVTYIPLGIALRYVLDALRKPTNNKMYYLFGIAALDRFKNKLKDYPQYCGHITAISHFKEFPPHLIETVENGRRSDDTLSQVGGSGEALGPAGPQQQMNVLPPVGEGATQGTTSGSSLGNPLPGRSTSAGPKISLPAGSVGKEIQQPSIAKATNIDTLLGAQVPEEKIPEPPENVQDKIAFIFNNLSVSNMTPKSDEMRDTIKEDYFPWLAQYLVMKRVSIEPNFHLLYSNFLDCLKMPKLNKMVQEEVYRNITVLLQSDKVAANFSDRSLLKNLGHFLGIISLAKNQPILYDDIALKPLLYEAYTKGAQELLYVVPFVAKVLEAVGKSRVFKLPNPWTEALMSVLKELHMEPDLKLNLKFEVEVLCKNLQIDINDLKPTHYLRDVQVKFSIECQLSTSKKELTVPVDKPATPSEQLVRTTTPMIMGMPGASLSSNFPPPAAPPPPPVPPQQQQPPMQINTVTPRFSFHDINVYSLATLQSHLTIKSDIPLLQSQPQLKNLVRLAVEKAVQELIQVAAERAIKITLQTCEQVIRKDFALDPEEFRMRTAAQNMVRNLTAGMALITCREQLLQSIQNYLKQSFMQALVGRTPQQLSAQQKDMIEHAVTVIAADNVELGCCFIQKTAVDRALVDMDKRLMNDYEIRKQARQEGRRYCDPAVLTYQAERMPEQIRLKVGGMNPQQMIVYDEFARNIPGFLPGNDSAQPSGFLSKPMATNWPVDEISQVYDRCIAEFDQYMQSFSSKQGTPQYSQLINLREALHLARNSRESSVAVALLQKAVEGLLDPTGQPGGETEVFPSPVLARYRECHLLILKTLQDQRAYGPQWTNKNVTQCLINHSDDYKYNIDLVEKLIRSNFINMQLYDQHLAQALENGMNYMALRFAIQLVKLFLVDDQQGSVTEADFYHTIEMLNKISRGQSPEGLPQLMELIRSNYDAMLDKAPGGPTHMMRTGISQAREYDDPQGLHEKTEYLLREWVNIYHSPTSGRDSTRGFATFVHQMHHHGILRTDELITRFFRLCTEMCVDLSYRLLQVPDRAVGVMVKDVAVGAGGLGFDSQADQIEHSVFNDTTTGYTLRRFTANLIKESTVSPSIVNPTLVRAKCFHTLDAFVRLITLLVKHSGDAVNSVTKINLLNKVLGIVVGVLLHDHETRQIEYHQMPYHRIFIMLFYELNAPEHVLESINFQTLTAFTNTYHILRPSKAPGFAFAWLELISYRAFISRMLLHTPQQKGWPMYAQLLIDLFKFLAPFLRNVELSKSVQILYKGTLRLLLVLLHDFPEFLCDYHYGFCDVIPANCIQLRNLILSAFPRNMRLPDPFTPNLKVDMLQEINNAPRILTNFVAVMPPQFLTDLDSYLKTRAPVTFLSELRTNLQRSCEAGTKYNISLINSLVMHVGTQAIAYIRSKGGAPSMASITHSSHMDIFQNLAVDLDTEGRYLFLNAIANQLRYPNSHTHYFSCTLLYLFAETNQESIQEQITRVLLERLIVNRPHPWGLLITFIELIKNPNFKFWSHEFVHCAPEISKLFESVARSCMGKQFNQQGGAEVSSSTAPVTAAAPTS